MLEKLLIANSFLVELNLGAAAPTAGRRIAFQDVPMLRNIRLYGLQVISETQLTRSPNDAVVVSAAGCAGAILTLNIKGANNNQSAEDIYQYPLFDMVPSSNGGLIRWFNGIVPDLPKSYVILTDVAAISASESFMFNFIYRPL